MRELWENDMPEIRSSKRADGAICTASWYECLFSVSSSPCRLLRVRSYSRIASMGKWEESSDSSIDANDIFLGAAFKL